MLLLLMKLYETENNYTILSNQSQVLFGAKEESNTLLRIFLKRKDSLNLNF